MPSFVLLALPVVIYLSLCALPRAAGSIYTIGAMFLLAAALSWSGLLGDAATAVLIFAQVAIVLAGLVQGLRLLALPADQSPARYYALVIGGMLFAAAILRTAFGA